MGMFDHSSRSAYVRSGTDVGQEGMAHSLRSNSSQRCSIGLRSGVPPPQTRSSMSLWTLLCALVRSHDGTGRGRLQTVPTKLGA